MNKDDVATEITEDSENKEGMEQGASEVAK
jgi:hypothetical protein